MAKPSSRISSGIEDPRKFTLRARGIPRGLDVRGARNLLSASLEAEIHSLDSLAASSDGRKGQVATFRLSESSAKLDGDRTEWLVLAAGLEGVGGKQLLVDTHFEGFTPLHDPVDDTGYAIDCIAISGLGSHAFGSWKDRHSPYMWLRDALPQYVPNARILIYGYDSKLAGSQSFQNLADIGARFRASLKVALGSVSRERPLIFVAHSLGGLVLKQAMVQMFSGGPADSRNFKATYGILFFGVPNQGMDISSLLAMVRDQPNLHFLSTLSKDGGFLQGLIEKFRATFDYQDSRIHSFYETEKSPTAQEGEPGKWSMNGRPAVLVDRHSARSGRSWEEVDHFHLPISRNHSGMVKFSEYSEDCGIVCDILRQFGEGARAVISRRWWWWEKEFAPKIGFSGNPDFKMLSSDAFSLPPVPALKLLPTGSAARQNLPRDTDSKSDRRSWIPSTPEPHLYGSATAATNPNVGAASHMCHGALTRGRLRVDKVMSEFKSVTISLKFSSKEPQASFVKAIEEIHAKHGPTISLKFSSKEPQMRFVKAIVEWIYAKHGPKNLAIIDGYIEMGPGFVKIIGKLKKVIVVTGPPKDLRDCLRRTAKL